MTRNLGKWSTPIVATGVCLLLGAACSRQPGSARSDSIAGEVSKADTAAATPSVRGTVASISDNALSVKTDTGAVTVQLTRPLEVYDRQPSSLENVKQNSFIGVTTVKQPDGTERATEIHIFPEALRGMGEGSRMMAQGSAGGGSRMTNGSVSGGRMTNGTASPSRMSNGTVASTTGSTLVVQYAGGQTKVSVPPNTPVTEIKSTSKQVVVGDRVVVVTKKRPDGSLVSNRVMLAGK
jgi:hypothetical protein